jgi:hypothetical protein
MEWASHAPEGNGVLDGCSRLRHLESWITMLRNKYLRRETPNYVVFLLILSRV